MQVYSSVLEEDGVVLVPSVLSRESASDLRKCVVNEIQVMRNIIRNDPSQSISLFYVPAKIHFETPRGYVLLPLRDSESVKKGKDDVGVLVRCTQQLLQKGTLLSKLFARVCNGDDSQLYTTIASCGPNPARHDK